MTARQKQDAEEQRLEIFNAVNWTCVVCGEPLTKRGTAQLGHRVPKHKSMVMKWGPEVVNHVLNLIPVCGLKDNDAVSLGTIRNEAKALMERIVRVTTGRESMPNLGEYYRAVGQEVRAKR